MRQRRFDQQRHAGPVVAEQDGVLEQRVGEDEALDGLWRDVLASKGDDDVLDAVGDYQEPVDVDVWKKGYLKTSGSFSLRRIYSFQAIASILCPSKQRDRKSVV